MSSGQEELARKRKRVEEQQKEMTPGKTGRSRRKKAKVEGAEAAVAGNLTTEDAEMLVASDVDGEAKSEATSTPLVPGEITKRRRRPKPSSAQHAPGLETLPVQIPASVVVNKVAASGNVATSVNGSEKKHKGAGEKTKTEHQASNGILQVQAQSGNAGSGAKHKTKTEHQASNGRLQVQAQPSNTGSVVRHKKSDIHRKGGSESNQWALSSALSGVLLGVDPLFSPDEKHLILATDHGVQIYSSTTSLLVISLHVEDVSAYALSAANPALLYVATRNGQISIWNWLEGQRVNRWTIDSQIVAMTAVVTDSSDQDTVFTLDKGKKWMVTAHKFGGKEDPTKTDVVTLLKHDNPLRSFKVLDKGFGICAISLDGFVVGKRTGSIKSASSLKDLSYTWREVKTTEPPTCFSVRTGSLIAVAKQAKKKTQPPASGAAVDVAVGGLSGRVLVYLDVFNKLDMNESPSKAVHSSSALTVRELHWHREAVGALGWSLDGNYIISGGRETVLVLWQLDTGKRQYLPNLESPIQSLTVSPSGSSYAVRLGDNSVMILSTSELKPTANIAGIQSLSTTANISSPLQLKTVDALSKEVGPARLPKVNAFVNPRDLQQLILAVPAHQGDSTTFVDRQIPAPYLQTFDVTTARHISRQAMTRTNATNTTLGPEGNRIREPNVKQVQASHNGRWLATVDEWSPPPHDVADLSVSDEDSRDNVKRQRDSQLRFWSWDDSGSQWTLNSRISTPHSGIDPLAAGSVLDMAADPSGLSFATIGEDSVVRVWAPITKLADGRLVRGNPIVEQGSSDVWWKKRFEIPLSKEAVAPASAKLAYTADGTCLAVHQTFPSSHATFANRTIVHFIDADMGVLRTSRDNLLWSREEICDIGFLEQHLVVVGRRAAQVWDVTTWESHMHIPIATSRNISISSSLADDLLPVPKLAVNAATRTFALVVSELLNQPAERSAAKGINYNNLRTRLRIYSPFRKDNHDGDDEIDAGNPIFETPLPRPALALLSASASTPSSLNNNNNDNDDGGDITGQRRGYIILDTSAVLRTLRPEPGRGSSSSSSSHHVVVDDVAVSSALPPTPPASSPSPSSREDDDEADENVEMSGSAATPAPAVVVVRPEHLAELFDYPTHAPPSMRELCRGVMGLFARVQGESRSRGVRIGSETGTAGIGSGGLDGEGGVLDIDFDGDGDGDVRMS